MLNDDLKFLLNHIMDQHLTKLAAVCQEPDTNVDERNEDLIVKQVVESMLAKLEGSKNDWIYKCNQKSCVKSTDCEFDTKALLNKHILEEHSGHVNKIKCFYCDDLFDLVEKKTKKLDLSGYTNHIVQSHKKLILSSLLLSEEMKTNVGANVDACLNAIDWQELYLNEMIEIGDQMNEASDGSDQSEREDDGQEDQDSNSLDGSSSSRSSVSGQDDQSSESNKLGYDLNCLK